MQRASFLATAAAFSVVAAAGAQDHILTMGFADSGDPAVTGNSYPAVRLTDNNLDGFIDSTEIHIFLTKTGATGTNTIFQTDCRKIIEDGEFSFYLCDSSEGVIWRATDANHNGVIEDDPSEIGEYFRFGFSGSPFAPDSLDLWVDPATGRTICYVAMEASGPNAPGEGIHRLVDLNSDGDATDAGEQSLFVSTAMNLTVPDANGMPVAINADNFEYVRVLGGGKIAVWQGGSFVMQDPLTGQYPPTADGFVWYAFTDNNGTAVPEVLFNPSELNNFARLPEFTGGTFPDLDVVDPLTAEAWNSVRFMEVVPRSGPIFEDAYYFFPSYRAGGIGDANGSGNRVSGLCFRWLDSNFNQTLDTTELSLFGNMSAQTYAGVAPVTVNNVANASTISMMDNPIYSVGAIRNSFSFTFDITNQEAILSMNDDNNNGVIEQGEARMDYFTPTPYGSPFSPMFGPFIEEHLTLGAGEMPGPFFDGLAPYGDGCVAPTLGLKPVMNAWGGSPALGNAQFAIGAMRAPAFAPVFMVTSFTQGSTPLDPFGLPGCTSLTVSPQTIGFVGADSDGRAMFALPIPNNPNLAGLQFNFQCVINDFGGTQQPFYTSNALELTVQ